MRVLRQLVFVPDSDPLTAPLVSPPCKTITSKPLLRTYMQSRSLTQTPSDFLCPFANPPSQCHSISLFQSHSQSDGSLDLKKQKRRRNNENHKASDKLSRISNKNRRGLFEFPEWPQRRRPAVHLFCQLSPANTAK